MNPVYDHIDALVSAGLIDRAIRLTREASSLMDAKYTGILLNILYLLVKGSPKLMQQCIQSGVGDLVR